MTFCKSVLKIAVNLIIFKWSGFRFKLIKFTYILQFIHWLPTWSDSQMYDVDMYVFNLHIWSVRDSWQTSWPGYRCGCTDHRNICTPAPRGRPQSPSRCRWGWPSLCADHMTPTLTAWVWLCLNSGKRMTFNLEFMNELGLHQAFRKLLVKILDFI